ncbi:MAG: YciI family protein [Opitutaceae bacterium]
MQTNPAPATSSYMLIFRDSRQDTYKALSPEQRQKLLSDWYSWYDGLIAAGKLQHGHPLEAEGRIVSSDGGRVVDGPFAEAKEVVGGYFLLTVEGLEEATAIARQCPVLKLDLPFTVEVRQVANMCPILASGELPEAVREFTHV